MAENARNTRYPVRVWMQFCPQFNTSSFASTFHFLGAFSTSISRHFNAAFSTLRCYLFHFARLQFVFYFNQTIALIIQVLTTFLQLKYQGIDDENESPFATHPKAMRVAVYSSILYYLALIILLKFPLCRFAVAAYHCLVSSGYASIASLASVLLPDSFSPFVYAVFGLLSASELLWWLYRKLAAEEDDAELQTHRRGFRRFLNNICRGEGSSSAEWLQRLPI